MYKSLVKQYHIDNQQFQNYLKKYPPTNTMLNYEPINDNKKLYGRQTWKYDYDVKNPVDLSKLFLQTHMAQYVAFDETCDASALLAIVINIDQFPLAVQKDANEVMFVNGALATNYIKNNIKFLLQLLIITLDVCFTIILYSDWLTAHQVLFLKQLHYSIKLFIHDNTWSHNKVHR